MVCPTKSQVSAVLIALYRKGIHVVPILVGAISTSKEKTYGKLLAPYLADPDNFFVVSSDFCHWYAARRWHTSFTEA